PTTELEPPRDHAEQEREPEHPERTGVERHALVVGALVPVLSAEARDGRRNPAPTFAGLRRRDEESEDLREAERHDGDRWFVSMTPTTRPTPTTVHEIGRPEPIPTLERARGPTLRAPRALLRPARRLDAAAGLRRGRRSAARRARGAPGRA